MKPATRLVPLALFLALTLPRTGVAESYPIPSRYESLKGEELCEPLEGILNGTISSYRDVRVVIRKAGESGITGYKPLLRQIAERYSSSELLCFRIFHSLWLLGEPVDFFLEKAELFESEPGIASAALYILPRWHDDARVRELMARLRESGNKRGVEPAYLLAHHALVDIDEYQTLTSTSEKVRFLLPLVKWGAIPDDSPQFGMSPTAFWARRELAAISEKAPDATATEISRFRVDPAAGTSRSPGDFFAQFISQAARDRLRALQSEERQPKVKGYSVQLRNLTKLMRYGVWASCVVLLVLLVLARCRRTRQTVVPGEKRS